MTKLSSRLKKSEEVAVQIYGHLWNAPQVEYRVAIMFCDAVRVPGPAPQLVQDVGHSTNRVGLRVVDAALYPAQFFHLKKPTAGLLVSANGRYRNPEEKAEPLVWASVCCWSVST